MKRLCDYLLLLLLLFPYGPVWAQGPAPEADISTFDSTEVLSLLDEAIRLDRTDTIETVLERALAISEIIGFDRGAEGAYHGLIRQYRTIEALSEELGIRLKRQNFYQRRKRYQDLASGAEEIGDLYFSNGLYSNASAAYREADSLAIQHAPVRHYRLVKQRARSKLYNGDYSDAKAHLREGLSLAKERNDIDDQLWMHQLLGQVAHLQKNYRAELGHARQAHRLAQKGGQTEASITALNNIGYAYKYLGEGDSAAFYFEKVLEELPLEDKTEARATMYANLGILNYSEGRVTAAIKELEKAANAYERVGNRAAQASTYDYLALIYLQKQDHYNALEFNTLAINEAIASRAKRVEGSSYKTRSLILQGLYEFEDALEYYLKFDSLASIERDSRRDILKEAADLERLERQFKIGFATQALQAEEIARLEAENETKAKKEALQRKELELKDSQLAYKQVEAKRALNALMLLEEKRKTEQQEAEITDLNNKTRIAELEARNEKQRAKEKAAEAELARQNLELAENEARLTELELAERSARIQSLFYLLGGMGLLVLLILLALVLVRRKNRIIAQEREKSDNLLLNILPVEVANELKEKGRAVPRNYEEVTVVFTDFSGFTKISEKLTPEQLVGKLDAIFLEFDRITEVTGLTRIKTIGDAYMAACGLPKADKDHADKSVRAALMMRDFIRSFNNQLSPNEPKWNIRIGVHSGPVVAGVVGEKKFAYDIWGDTVNTASRMESSGAVGKVNISGTTHEIVQRNFSSEYRGKVQAKNKGEIDMYFVERAREFEPG